MEKIMQLETKQKTKEKKCEKKESFGQRNSNIIFYLQPQHCHELHRVYTESILNHYRYCSST